jgi:hypothetical protein
MWWCAGRGRGLRGDGTASRIGDGLFCGAAAEHVHLLLYTEVVWEAGAILNRASRVPECMFVM